jgi:hypothetical protein
MPAFACDALLENSGAEFYGNIANPACRKFVSKVKALRIPNVSMRTKDVQSVKDHPLSRRWTKSRHDASKVGVSTLASLTFFDFRIA